MKKPMKKIVIIGMTSSLVLTSAGIGTLAMGAESTARYEDAVKEAEQEAAVTQEKEAEESAPEDVDETVYVFADTTGNVKKIMVSYWLHELQGDDADTYLMDTVDADAPVEMKITYTLDGQEIAPEDLAGQSGHVKIRFEYTNHVYQDVVIGDEPSRLYVPFVMLTGMILDNEAFQNVEVTNGRLINDGARQIVVGFALPGMQENLDLSKDKIDIPDYFEVEADAEDFELQMTLTYANAGLLNNLDLDDIEDFDDLKDSMDELKDAMEQLIDGSGELADGLDTLLEESGQLTDGADDLEDGAKQLMDGAKELDDGAQDLLDGTKELADGVKELDDGAQQLSDGAQTLADGLTQVIQNNDALTQGAAQVFTSLLQVAQTQLTSAGLSIDTLTIDNYSEVLGELAASYSEEGITAQAREQVAAGVDAMGDALYETYIEQNAEDIYMQYLAGIADDLYLPYQAVQEEPLTDEQKAQILEGAREQLTEEQKSQIRAGALAQLTDEQKTQIREGAIEQTMASEEVQAQIQEALGSTSQLTELVDQLTSFQEFYDGILTYTDAVQQAADGASELHDGTVTLKDGTAELLTGAGDLQDGTQQLKDGTAELYDGTIELHDGTVELQDKIPDLIDGVQQLTDGGHELADGLQELNDEGIQKIIDAVDGDLTLLVDRLRSVQDLSKSYHFLADGEDLTALDADAGSYEVKFIYRTDAITK